MEVSNVSLVSGIGELTYDSRDLCGMLGIAHSTLRGWVAKGEFPKPAGHEGPFGRSTWKIIDVAKWFDENEMPMLYSDTKLPIMRCLYKDRLPISSWYRKH